MKAAVLKAPGLLELDDLPDPICPKGGALIEVKSCAVCGTDVKMIEKGHKDLAYPRILGHEIVGRIIEADGGHDFQENDLVQIWPGIACGKCRPCRQGADNRCQGMRILGFNFDGGYAELLALPAQSIPRSINPISCSIDPALVALAEPLACCINGQDTTRVSKGDAVLIFGAGPIGCLHALLARERGAEKIIVADKLPGRIRMIERHVSIKAIDPDETVKDVVISETEGSGVDVILTATPEVRVDRRLQELLAPGGRICIFSGPKLGDYEAEIDLRSLHYREQEINGSYGCTSQQNREAVNLLASKKIKADWIITKRTTLENIHDSLNHSSSRKGLKSVICRI